MGQLKRISICAYLALLFVSAMIVLLPESPGDSLVPKDGWKVAGTWFQRPDRPNEIEARGSIRNSSDSIFFRSWSPPTGPTQGRITSVPFKAPRFITIPFSGFPFDAKKQIDLFLKCAETGDRHSVARANTHNRWSEAVFAIDKDWCKSDVVLEARTESRTLLLAFGTPFAVSALSYLKTRAAGQIFIHFVLFAALFTVGLAGALVWAKLGLPGTTFSAQIMSLCLLAYSTFFATWFSPTAGTTLSWLLMLASATILAAFVILDRGFLTTRIRELQWGTGLWFLGSLGFLLLLYSVDNGGGSWSSNYRFSPSSAPSDNQLSLLISEEIQREAPNKNLLGNWQISDRPPLLTGIIGLVRPLILLLQTNNDGPHLYHHGYHIAGTIMMCLWLPVVAFTLAKAGLASQRDQLFVIFIMALSPLALSNSVYLSPKMLSGALGIMVFSALLLPGTNSRGTNPDRVSQQALIAAGVFAALSLLAHGGGVFAIAVIGLWALIGGFLPGIRSVILAGSLSIAILSPWVLWQRLVDPPGNALAKFAFAGTFGWGEREVSVTDTILRAYSTVGFGEWIGSRWEALLSIFGVGRIPYLRGLWMSKLQNAEGIADVLRIRDYFFLFPAMAVFVVTALFLLAPRWGIIAVRSRTDGLATASRRMMSVSLITYAVSVLLIWTAHVVYTLGFPAHLLLLMGALTGLLAWGKPKVTATVAIGFATYSVAVWILDPILDASRVDWVSFGLFSTLCFLVLAAVLRQDEIAKPSQPA